MSDRPRRDSAGNLSDALDDDADETTRGPCASPWFVGRSPQRKQLNRQFIFYGLALLLVGLMLLAVKRLSGAP